MTTRRKRRKMVQRVSQKRHRGRSAKPPAMADHDRVEKCAAVVKKAQFDVTVEILSRRRSVKKGAELISNVLGYADMVCNRSPMKDQRACTSGCTSCCYNYVSVTAMEAIVMADYLRWTLGPDELDEIKCHIANTASKLAGLTLEQRAKRRIPCSILNCDGWCRVYDVRPVVCRGWTSTSRDRCEEAFATGIPSTTAPVDAWAFCGCAGILEGFRAGLNTCGLDAEIYELNAALHRALDTPDAAKRWINGECLFADCAHIKMQDLVQSVLKMHHQQRHRSDHT